MSTASEVLVFDWGPAIIGILDVDANVYKSYRTPEGMIEGAKRVLFSVGTIVSFNGDAYDLPELFNLLPLQSVERVIRGTHVDMLKETSDIRWPPVPGTSSINGPGLRATYRYYFGASIASPPEALQDDYVINNWTDCYQTAALWKKWKRGELAP